MQIAEFSSTCCRSTPIIHCLHWLRITERIEYKILPLHNSPDYRPTFHTCIITVQPQCSTCYSSCHSFPSTFIVIFTNSWSVFSLCFTSSLESIPCFSLTTSYLSVHPWLYACYFSSFRKFTTLIICNSFTLSLPARSLPLPQILSNIDPSRTDLTLIPANGV